MQPSLIDRLQNLFLAIIFSLDGRIIDNFMNSSNNYCLWRNYCIVSNSKCPVISCLDRDCVKLDILLSLLSLIILMIRFTTFDCDR